MENVWLVAAVCLLATLVASFVLVSSVRRKSGRRGVLAIVSIGLLAAAILGQAMWLPAELKKEFPYIMGAVSLVGTFAGFITSAPPPPPPSGKPRRRK